MTEIERVSHNLKSCNPLGSLALLLTDLYARPRTRILAALLLRHARHFVLQQHPGTGQPSPWPGGRLGVEAAERPQVAEVFLRPCLSLLSTS